MTKLLPFMLAALLLTACGAAPAPTAARRTTTTPRAKNDFKVEILVNVVGTVTGRLAKSNGDLGAIGVETAEGDQTVYLTEQTALSWDPRVKAIRAPATLDLVAGTRVEILAVEMKSQGWGPATWLRAKSVVLLAGN
jgi:hypothetical protein